MKLHVCSVLVIAALLFEVQVVSAQYTSDGEGFPLSSPLSIFSPSNCTFSSNSLKLDVVVKFLLGSKYMNLSYSLDGKRNVTLPLSETKEPVEVTRTYENGTVEIVTSSPFVPFTITGEAALTGLSDGTHNITVYAKYVANNVVGLDDSTVWFTIKTGAESQVLSSNSIQESGEADHMYFSSGAQVFSPINRTYNSRFLTLNLTFGAGLGIKCTLNYTIHDKYEGDIPLVLKNPTEIHIVNKATGLLELPELPEGSHCLTINVLCGVYDFHGVNPPGAPFEPTFPGSADYEATWSDSLYFTIDTGSEDKIPEFSAWTVLPAILSVTVVVIMLRKMLKNQKGADNVE